MNLCICTRVCFGCASVGEREGEIKEDRDNDCVCAHKKKLETN